MRLISERVPPVQTTGHAIWRVVSSTNLTYHHVPDLSLTSREDDIKVTYQPLPHGQAPSLALTAADEWPIHLAIGSCMGHSSGQASARKGTYQGIAYTAPELAAVIRAAAVYPARAAGGELAVQDLALGTAGGRGAVGVQDDLASPSGGYTRRGETDIMPTSGLCGSAP
jgi:hypothetical protein